MLSFVLFAVLANDEDKHILDISFQRQVVDVESKLILVMDDGCTLKTGW